MPIEGVQAATAPARVLVVDDEPQIRRFLDISLRAQGYTTQMFGTGAEGLAALEAQGADLVILDLGLPDLDGRDVLRRLREVSRVPVIVLTVRADEAEKVAVLDAGASDYVTKPFGTQELMARVRALLRDRVTATSAPPVLDDGYLYVDLARREVRVGGVPLVLGRKEYSLLALLIANAGRVITQPQLMRELWGPRHAGDTHYLRILVGKLRNKIGDAASMPRYIATEPGVGLRFIVPNAREGQPTRDAGI